MQVPEAENLSAPVERSRSVKYRRLASEEWKDDGRRKPNTHNEETRSLGVSPANGRGIRVAIVVAAVVAVVAAGSVAQARPFRGAAHQQARTLNSAAAVAAPAAVGLERELEPEHREDRAAVYQVGRQGCMQASALRPDRLQLVDRPDQPAGLRPDLGVFPEAPRRTLAAHPVVEVMEEPRMLPLASQERTGPRPARSRGSRCDRRSIPILLERFDAQPDSR